MQPLTPRFPSFSVGETQAGMAQLQQRIARGIGLRGVGSGETAVFRDRVSDGDEGAGHRFSRGKGVVLPGAGGGR